MTHNQFLHILFENEIRWRSPGGRQNRMKYTGSGVDETDAVMRWMVHVLANQVMTYYMRGLMGDLLAFSLRPLVVRRQWDLYDADPVEQVTFELEGASLREGRLIDVRVNRVVLNDPAAPKLYEYFGSSNRQGYAAGGMHDWESTDRYFIKTTIEEAVDAHWLS